MALKCHLPRALVISHALQSARPTCGAMNLESSWECLSVTPFRLVPNTDWPTVVDTTAKRQPRRSAGSLFDSHHSPLLWVVVRPWWYGKHHWGNKNVNFRLVVYQRRIWTRTQPRRIVRSCLCFATSNFRNLQNRKADLSKTKYTEAVSFPIWCRATCWTKRQTTRGKLHHRHSSLRLLASKL